MQFEIKKFREYFPIINDKLIYFDNASTTQKPTFSNHYPGAIVADDIVANVISDPDVIFEVKIDDANGGRAQVGSTCNIATYSAGSTKSGISFFHARSKLVPLLLESQLKLPVIK